MPFQLWDKDNWSSQSSMGYQRSAKVLLQRTINWWDDVPIEVTIEPNFFIYFFTLIICYDKLETWTRNLYSGRISIKSIAFMVLLVVQVKGVGVFWNPVHAMEWWILIISWELPLTCTIYLNENLQLLKEKKMWKH